MGEEIYFSYIFISVGLYYLLRFFLESAQLFRNRDVSHVWVTKSKSQARKGKIPNSPGKFSDKKSSRDKAWDLEARLRFYFELQLEHAGSLLQKAPESGDCLLGRGLKNSLLPVNTQSRIKFIYCLWKHCVTNTCQKFIPNKLLLLSVLYWLYSIFFYTEYTCCVSTLSRKVQKPTIMGVIFPGVYSVQCLKLPVDFPNASASWRNKHTLCLAGRGMR